MSISDLKSLAILLFGFSRSVDRRTYATVGFVLMVLKLGVDLTILFLATGRLWSPFEFLSILALTDQVPGWTALVLMLWALPFAWIGLSMSVRRAMDASLSPWVGLLFCIPVMNFFVMLGLCLQPTREIRPKPWVAPEARQRRLEQRQSGIEAVGLGLLLGLVMVLIGVVGLRSLGLVLFAGTPLGMGVLAGYTFNRNTRRSGTATAGVATATVVTMGALLLLFAMEGVLCLMMAFPLAIPLAIFGALIGREVVGNLLAQQSPLVMLLVALPLLAWAEPRVLEPRLRQVTTVVQIAAPPEVVWEKVISFEPLEPPKELWFRLGIAYPQQARIFGQGVGAVRHCEFSTGAFVEPITVWNPPRHLAFDVEKQPEPLRELSPYPVVYADHLEGSLSSRRGEFRLSPAADGGTRLEGTTWYELSMFPEIYWQLWTDSLIHTVHGRVLRHIKHEAEG